MWAYFTLTIISFVNKFSSFLNQEKLIERDREICGWFTQKKKKDLWVVGVKVKTVNTKK